MLTPTADQSLSFFKGGMQDAFNSKTPRDKAKNLATSSVFMPCLAVNHVGPTWRIYKGSSAGDRNKNNSHDYFRRLLLSERCVLRLSAVGGSRV